MNIEHDRGFQIEQAQLRADIFYSKVVDLVQNPVKGFTNEGLLLGLGDIPKGSADGIQELLGKEMIRVDDFSGDEMGEISHKSGLCVVGGMAASSVPPLQILRLGNSHNMFMSFEVNGVGRDIEETSRNLKALDKIRYTLKAGYFKPVMDLDGAYGDRTSSKVYTESGRHLFREDFDAYLHESRPNAHVLRLLKRERELDAPKPTQHIDLGPKRPRSGW